MELKVNSVILLSEVLEEMRDKKSKFSGIILSESQFLLLVKIQPVLDSFRKVSETFLADKHPALHLACSQLVNRHIKLTFFAQSDIQCPINNFVQVLIRELKRRFPNCGATNHFHAM